MWSVVRRYWELLLCFAARCRSMDLRYVEVPVAFRLYLWRGGEPYGNRVRIRLDVCPPSFRSTLPPRIVCCPRSHPTRPTGHVLFFVADREHLPPGRLRFAMAELIHRRAREKLLGCHDQCLPALLRRDALSPAGNLERSASLNVAEIAGRFAREIQLNAVAIFRLRTALTAPPTSASATCLRQTNAARRLRKLVLRMRPHGFVALGACGGRRRCGAGGHYWPRARDSPGADRSPAVQPSSAFRPWIFHLR
jgi:hypothetical protein